MDIRFSISVRGFGMKGAITKEGWPYKLACDGFDLLNSKLGEETLNDIAVSYVKEHCVVSTFSDAESFVFDCICNRRRKEFEHPLRVDLRDKYEVGVFRTSKEYCIDNKYILFNQTQLEEWDTTGVHLWDLEFLVIPSRDSTGKINEIGFRLLNTSLVHDAFKWLFMFGQQATFGLQLCDMSKPIIAVEGAFDWIALAESGYKNIIGLGSAFISQRQKEYVKGKELVMCLDQDSFGLSQRVKYNKYCFFKPDAKDPFEAFCNYGRVDLIEVS